MHYQPPPAEKLYYKYIDEYLLVVNKPAGLLSVPGRGEDKQDCLLSRVQQDYPDALIVHRLDMSTSGLIIMARSKEAQRQLSILFQKRKIEKKYIAVVSGKLLPPQGEINLPLLTDWPRRPKQKVDFIQGKPSQTMYRLLTYDDINDCSRVELTPLTGRSHQLRVHMQAIGHSILGDELYAADNIQKAAGRLLLHASKLIFQHPFTKEKLEIDLTADF